MARLFTVWEYNKAWRDLLTKVLASFHELDPLLSQMPSTTIRHRGPIRNVSGPEPLDQGLKAVESSSILENEDIRNLNVESHSAFLHELVTGMIREIASGMIQIVSEVTDHTGNVVDGKGQHLTPDLFLDTLEKLAISFDDEGNPLMPTLIAAPEAVKRLLEAPYTEAHEQRRLAILERKKEEYFASKRTRRIR